MDDRPLQMATGCVHASLLGVDGQLKYQAVLDTSYQVDKGEFIQYSDAVFACLHLRCGALFVHCAVMQPSIMIMSFHCRRCHVRWCPPFCAMLIPIDCLCTYT